MALSKHDQAELDRLLKLQNDDDPDPVIVKWPGGREVILRGKRAVDFLIKEGLAAPKTIAKATGLDDDGPDVEIKDDGDVVLTKQAPRYY